MILRKKLQVLIALKKGRQPRIREEPNQISCSWLCVYFTHDFGWGFCTLLKKKLKLETSTTYLNPSYRQLCCIKNSEHTNDHKIRSIK
jgi:hypothetical protein